MLADGADDFLRAAGVPAWVVGLFVLTVAWWRGWIMRTADHQAAMARQRETCLAELAAKDVELAGERRAMTLVQDRLHQVVADRDAWRDAHAEATRALHASERAASALMEQGHIVVNVVDALKHALQRGAGG